MNLHTHYFFSFFLETSQYSFVLFCFNLKHSLYLFYVHMNIKLASSPDQF